MKKLLLFDIDGTLIKAAGGHTEAFAVAFKEVYGIYGSIYMIQPQGRTDQQIIRAVMQKCGIDNEIIDRKLNDCLKAMCNYFESVKDYISATTFTGLPATLDTLDKNYGPLGLVTGNLEPIAYGKLTSAGIGHHFKLGGFGSDDAERSKLVEKVTITANKQFDFHDQDQIYLFGDTPKDIEAANLNGVKAIGVTTGIFNADDLWRAGAYRVINSLGNQAAVIEAIGN
jgi:phosphoglycolate phosphatase-like HAD superfamily hydrolase